MALDSKLCKGCKGAGGAEVKPELESYFFERYKKCSIQVVPGHWPDFQSKEQIDKWIAFLEKMENHFHESFADTDSDQ